MLVAVILPTAYLDLIADEDYHLVLAHLLYKDKGYTDFYKELAKDDSKYLILDNGAWEGQTQDIHVLAELANDFGFNEIVLPDYIGRAPDTLYKGYEALRLLRGELGWEGNVMAVAQGQNIHEWTICAEVMGQFWDVNCLGIPKHLAKNVGLDARILCLKQVWSLYSEVHLLGCSNDPQEPGKVAQEFDVRGVDSCIPYVYTKNRLVLTAGLRRPHIPMDFADTSVDRKLLKHNIALWKEMCNA